MFVLSLNSTNAFLGDEFSLNMYENIDEGIDDLENTIYKKQLKTDRTGNVVDIKDKITELTNVEGLWDCFIQGDLTSTDIENIGNGRIDKLFEVISEDCRWASDTLSMELFIRNYYTKTNALDIEARRIAKEQADAIAETARIWIYSDGYEENSPFDLIVDLQDINNIIFSKEIPYLWVNREDNDAIFNCLYWEFAGDNPNEDEIVRQIEWSIGNRDQAFLDCQNSSDINTFGENFELEWLSEWVAGGQDGGESGSFDFSWVGSDGNTLVCQDSSVNTWLSPEAIAGLIQSTSDRGDVALTSDFLQDIPESDNPEDTSIPEPVEYPDNTYAKMKDNDQWPCNEFFCIRVEFLTANYNLLTWGKTKSIEAFLKVSNEHLKKFAHTSLVQSKMTQNNFEIAWRDLNLPDLFNSSVQIQFVPPPILNLDKVQQDTNEQKLALWDDFKADNLLSAYFSHSGMNYERQNDMRLFQETAEERKSLYSSQELSLNQVWEEAVEQNGYLNNTRTEFARSILDKKVNNNDMEDFYNQYAELERFSRGMRDYAFAASAIIKKMKEIPVFKNG